MHFNFKLIDTPFYIKRRVCWMICKLLNLSILITDNCINVNGNLFNYGLVIIDIIFNKYLLRLVNLMEKQRRLNFSVNWYWYGNRKLLICNLSYIYLVNIVCNRNRLLVNKLLFLTKFYGFMHLMEVVILFFFYWIQTHLINFHVHSNRKFGRR